MSTDDVDLPSLANVLAERLAEVRARLAEVEAERDAAKIGYETGITTLERILNSVHTEREAWRPVVEAAGQLENRRDRSTRRRRDSTWLSDHTKALIAAVDALPARNLDSEVPNPSLTAETVDHG